MNWSGEEGSAWIERGEDPSAVANPFGDAFRGSEVSELLTDLRDANYDQECPNYISRAKEALTS